MSQLQIDFTAKPRFDGQTYDASLDESRLTGQLFDIFDYMKIGLWKSLREISAATGHGEASISARLRDLRKPKFGSYNVDRRRFKDGLFEYRVWK